MQLARTLPLALLAVTSLAPVARAQDGDTRRASDDLFPTRPRIETLPNGLTVVAVPWPSPGIVAYYTLVRAGSRDEVEQGHTGFAHFFEHMMFRGTEAHPQHEYDAALQRVGADNNAFTTQDYTCYTITAPSSALPMLIDLESDRFQHLAYAEEVFRTEAGAVRGEYQTHASDPDQPMWETLSEIAFSRHTYGHTTLGYLRDIERMPGEYAYSRQFFARFYTPDDTTLIVVGDLDADALMRDVRARYGGWRGHRARPRVPVEPEPTAGARRDIAWDGASPPRMFVAFRTPAFVGDTTPPPRRAAALRESAALEMVHDLAFHESSALYQRLVVSEQRLLALSSWAGERSRDPGVFLVSATLAPGQSFDDILASIQAELDRIAGGGESAERVREVQQHLRYGLAMRLETPASVAAFIAEMLAVGGRMEAIDEYLSALGAATAADVAGVAQRYLVPSRRFVVTLAPRAAEGGGAR